MEWNIPYPCLYFTVSPKYLPRYLGRYFGFISFQFTVKNTEFQYGAIHVRPYICISTRLEMSTWATSKVLGLAYEVEIAPTIMITRAKPQTGLCQGLQKTTTYAKFLPRNSFKAALCTEYEGCI
mgnify:CR=1 FL=1